MSRAAITVAWIRVSSAASRRLTLQISVVIPTHNPHIGGLRRTLVGRREQTLAIENSETLLIDNASNPPLTIAGLSPHAPVNLLIVRESVLGLTPARRHGFREAWRASDGEGIPRRSESQPPRMNPPLVRCLPSLPASARILDAGGWFSPCPAATDVIDLMPYETRGGGVSVLIPRTTAAAN